MSEATAAAGQPVAGEQVLPGRARPGAGAAFFDLDHTLTKRDTVWPWLLALHGRAKVLAAVADAGVIGPFRPLTGALDDKRSRIKARLFGRLLRGVAVERAKAAAQGLAGSIPWRVELVAQLRAHRAAGRGVIVVTGSPALVARALTSGFGVDEVLGTELEEQNGVLTGRFVGENNVRSAKAERVRAWLARHGNVGETWGYGNAPHDLPMLELLDHRHVV